MAVQSSYGNGTVNLAEQYESKLEEDQDLLCHPHGLLATAKPEIASVMKQALEVRDKEKTSSNRRASCSTALYILQTPNVTR